MSWLNKFFDLFLGEKEEEHEREPNTHAQIPKQQIPDQPEGKFTRMEDPKIYYEYPKGNFRFPVVPDGYKRTEQNQDSGKGTNAASRPGIMPPGRSKPSGNSIHIKSLIR